MARDLCRRWRASARFDAADAEYKRLLAACERLGYEVVTLPRMPVSERADLVLKRLGENENGRTQGPAVS